MNVYEGPGTEVGEGLFNPGLSDGQTRESGCASPCCPETAVPLSLALSFLRGPAFLAFLFFKVHTLLALLTFLVLFLKTVFSQSSSRSH